MILYSNNTGPRDQLMAIVCFHESSTLNEEREQRMKITLYPIWGETIWHLQLKAKHPIIF